MTTAPNSDAESAAESAEGESAHTDLVAKLVAEAFSGFTNGTKLPGALPSAPAEVPVPTGLTRLGGTDSPSAVPPVHPSSQPDAPKLATPGKTQSGAHAP